MGGGDLNTKKSWHPNTLKNQERVWAAERAAEQEKARIAELQRERAGERERDELQALGRNAGTLPAMDSDKLSWMYNQPNKSGDPEDYLLGKTIDKNYERLVAEDKTAAQPKNHVEHEVIPFSIRQLRGGAAGPVVETVDVARKLAEDPLAAIRRRELDARAQLLQNPLRLQKLRKLLQEDQEQRKSKKKSKKGKPDLDQLLVEKLSGFQGKEIDIESLLSKKKKKKCRSQSNANSGDSSLEHEKTKKKKKRNSSEREDTKSSRKKAVSETNKKRSKQLKGDDSTDEEVNENLRRKLEAFKTHMERKNSERISRNSHLETDKSSKKRRNDTSSCEDGTKNKKNRDEVHFGWSKSSQNQVRQSDSEDNSRKKRRDSSSEDRSTRKKKNRDQVKSGRPKNSRESESKSKKKKRSSSHSDDNSPKKRSKHNSDRRSGSIDRNNTRDLAEKALQRPDRATSHRRSSSASEAEHIVIKPTSDKTDRRRAKQSHSRRSSSPESGKKHNRHSSSKNISDRRQPAHRRSSSDTDSGQKEKSSNKEHDRREASERHQRSDRLEASHRRDDSSDSEGLRRTQFGLVSADGRKLTAERRELQQKKPTGLKKTGEGWQRPRVMKLSEADKEARRRDMVSAAADRERERARNLHAHRETSAREEAASSSAGFDPEFATRQTAAAAGGSMQQRIRSNVYNIQRSSRHMDTSFVRR